MNSSTDEIRLKMEMLADEAYNCYKMQKVKEALCLYRKAYDAAIAIKDDEKMAKYKQLEGHCLCYLGLFREALSVLLPLSQTAQIVPHEHFSGIIDQIDIAVKIPIDLPKIQNLIQEAHNTIRQYGLQTARGMILIEESILAFMRYDYKLALEKAKEALDSYDQGAKISYNIIVYHRNIIDNLLLLNCVDEAREWISKFQEINTDLTFSKEISLFGFWAEIANLEGQYEVAYALAEQRLKLERETNSDCFVSLRLVVRIGISAGKLDVIRGYLAELLSMRHAKYGNWRYQVRLYIGDYYTALCQQEREKKIPSQKQFDIYWKLSEKFYKQAIDIGAILDNLLKCDGRQKEIKQRLERLAELKI